MGKNKENGKPTSSLSHDSEVTGMGQGCGRGGKTKVTKKKGVAMTLAIANKGCKDAVGCIGERRSVEAVMEAAFTFLIKGAKRLVQLNGREAGVLKRLFVEFTEAPENKKPEIMETVVEILFPDDFIGGASHASAEEPSVREKVDAARLYIGKQIRKRREELGMTQAQVAKKVGIPQSHVSRLESGKHAPTQVTIERIAEALNIRPSLLDPGHPDSPNGAKNK